MEYALTPLRLPEIIFQVDLRQWYGSTINVVRQGIWLAIIVALWFWGAPLSYVIGGRVLAAVIESGLIWAYGHRFLAEKGKFLWERAGMIFSHSFPIAFTSLLAMIYMRIDQVMLHKMTTDSILGQYVAAVRVSELFEMLPAALMMTLAPILAVSVGDPQKIPELHGSRVSLLHGGGLRAVRRRDRGQPADRTRALRKTVPAGGAAAGRADLVRDRRIFRRRCR